MTFTPWCVVGFWVYGVPPPHYQGLQSKGLPRSVHITPTTTLSVLPPPLQNGKSDSESPVDTATSTAMCEPKHATASLVASVEIRSKPPPTDLYRGNGILKRTSMVVEGVGTKGFIPMIRHGSHEVVSSLPSEEESSGPKFLPPI